MRVKVLFMDCETNGLYADECSVLSVSAIKTWIDIDTKEIREVSRFQRYYFPKKNEVFNREAVQVNGLSRQVINEKRNGATYPKTFKRDFEWNEYIKDIDLFVSHNIDFDKEFMILNRVKNSKYKRYFCTMKSNIYELKLEFEYDVPSDYGSYKYPSLSETARYYQIEINPLKLHDSIYDSELVLEIFKKMYKQDKVKLLRATDCIIF